MRSAVFCLALTCLPAPLLADAKWLEAPKPASSEAKAHPAGERQAGTAPAMDFPARIAVTPEAREPLALALLEGHGASEAGLAAPSAEALEAVERDLFARREPLPARPVESVPPLWQKPWPLPEGKALASNSPSEKAVQFLAALASPAEVETLTAAETEASRQAHVAFDRRAPAALPVALERSPTSIEVKVSISRQQMEVYYLGERLYEWPVSTARNGKVTPRGTFAPEWLSKDHRSRLYNDAPMPYAIFYDGHYAIHGTNQEGRLGRPASAGCVRLSRANAKELFAMVRAEGKENLRIEIID